MATRIKTVEFVTTTDVTPVASTVWLEKPIDIYIPEDSPVFRSCIFQAYVMRNNTTSTLSSPEMGISDDGVTWDDQVMPTVSSSSEDESWFYRRDVTLYFINNFDGATPPTSVEWNLRWRSSTNNTNNVAFKLILTYEYDDTSTTQIKTVKIPIVSNTDTLDTAYELVGGATGIPALDGSYLPEASITARQHWLEFYCSSVSTSARNIDIRINGGTDTRIFEHTPQGGGLAFHYAQTDITSEDLSAARSLEAKSSSASQVSHVGFMLCATYEFNASTTDKVHNSLMLPLRDFMGFTGYDTGQGIERQIVFQIQEPLTPDATPSIDTMESALVMYTREDFTVAVESQSGQTYIEIETTNSSGWNTVIHSIDGNGSGVAFDRGLNTVTVQIDPSAVDNPANAGYMMMYAVVNYQSGKATDGVGAHNQTRAVMLTETVQSNQPTSALQCYLPESSFYTNAVMTEVMHTWYAFDEHFVPFSIRRTAAEGGQRWETFVFPIFDNIAENSSLQLYFDSTDLWQPYPQLVSPTDYLDLTVSRSYANTAGSLVSSYMMYSAIMLYTYHTVSTDADVTVTNYTGDGSGITVFLLDGDDKRVDEVTTATGGTATGVVWDDTVQYRAVAEQGARSGASIKQSVV